MKRLGLFGCTLIVMLLVGCATSPGSITGADKLMPSARVGVKDTVSIAVNRGAAQSAMLEADAVRLQELVKREIDIYRAKNAKADIPAESYEVILEMVTYEQGNAFARAMLAGLGQLKLNGKVTILRGAGKEKVGEFVADKVFAWGGIYGASTRITDVEPAFAEAVAQGVTGIVAKQ